MNKQTGYVVIAFLLGVIATQYFLRKNHSENIDAAQVQSVELENADKQPARPPKHVLQMPSVQKPMKVSTHLSTTTIPQETQAIMKAPEAQQDLQPQPKKRIVELTLDEQNISELEQNPGELADKVVMHREDRGWRVNYLILNNPMNRVGLQNNDLVLYELIDLAKTNPKTGPLISRLEGVFSSLQK